MLCQQCGQAEAEWKVKEHLSGERGKTLRWSYLCDLCVMEVFGPWLGKRIPPLEEGEMFSSATKLIYKREGDQWTPLRRVK